MRRFNVKTKEHEMEVIIAGTPEEMKDKSYMDYLESAGREKTLDQLKRKPPRERPTKSKEEIGQALKELAEFRKRKKEGDIKKYY